MTIQDNANSKKTYKNVYKNENEYSIFYSYRPNNLLNKLAGIQKITYDGDNIQPVGWIAKLYALILCTCIGAQSVLLISELQQRDKVVPIIIVIDILANICVTVANIVSILLAAFLISPFMVRALRCFGPIDQKLNIKGKSSYNYLRNRIMMAQACLLTITISHFIYEIMVGVSLWVEQFRAITMHLADFFVYCQMLDFTTVVWIIVTRLKEFNSQLDEVIKIEHVKSKIEKVEIKSFVKEQSFVKVSDVHQRKNLYEQDKVNDTKTNDDLLRLMKIFDEIADVANIISSCYGLSLLFISTMTFLYIISTVNGLIMFKALVQEDPNHTILYIIGWCAPDTLYLLVAAFMSEKMKNEIEVTNNHIDKLTISAEHGTQQCELIENFSQLLSVREVFITAANFFPFDMTFILSLVGAVATYTVLLMQVKPDKVLTPLLNATNITNITTQS